MAKQSTDREPLNPRDIKRNRTEARAMLKYTNRILRKHGYRVAKTAREELETNLKNVAAELEPFESGAVLATLDDPHSAMDALIEAMDVLDKSVETHLAFARKSVFREYAESIGLAFAVALVLRAFVVEAFQIPSGSMQPTLEIGDHIFVSKLSYGISMPYFGNRLVEWDTLTEGTLLSLDTRKTQTRTT